MFSLQILTDPTRTVQEEVVTTTYRVVEKLTGNFFFLSFPKAVINGAGSIWGLDELLLRNKQG